MTSKINSIISFTFFVILLIFMIDFCGLENEIEGEESNKVKSAKKQRSYRHFITYSF